MIEHSDNLYSILRATRIITRLALRIGRRIINITATSAAHNQIEETPIVPGGPKVYQNAAGCGFANVDNRLESGVIFQSGTGALREQLIRIAALRCIGCIVCAILGIELAGDRIACGFTGNILHNEPRRK
jgi:hypothetical protein